MIVYYRIAGNIGGGGVEFSELAVFRKSAKFNLPVFGSMYCVMSINGTIMGLLKYVSMKGRPVRVCSAKFKNRQ